MGRVSEVKNRKNSFFLNANLHFDILAFNGKRIASFPFFSLFASNCPRSVHSPSFQIPFSNFIKPIHKSKRWKANKRIWTKTTIWDVPSVSDRIKSFGRGKVLNSCYSSHCWLRWKMFQMEIYILWGGVEKKKRWVQSASKTICWLSGKFLWHLMTRNSYETCKR